jgi:glycosyltransferase involved in cell wall biosynthesis
VDEIIVTANGKKVTEIEKYCSGKSKIKYFFHKWDKNFGEQRNFCASKIRRDADFYVWFDCDDVLIGAELLRGIADRAKNNKLDAVFFQYWYMCTFNGEPSAKTVKNVELTQMRERLLRPGAVTWKNRLHETPVPNENIDYKYTQIKYNADEQIVWLHLGITKDLSVEDQIEKMNRNRELLELQLQDEHKTKEGADPRTLLYLMKIYAETNDKLDECITMGGEYMTKSGWDAERAMCCAIIADCLGKKDQDKEAKDFLFKAISEYPYDPILYLHLSRVCLNLKQYHEMKHWLQIALSLDSDKSSASLTNIAELKILSTKLLMKYYFEGERNMKKSYESAKLLYKEEPTTENKENLDYLKELNDLENASKDAHDLMIYYEELNNSLGVLDVVKSMPKKMQDLPFAWYMYNKHKTSRTWGKDEICYYASFGQSHFEQWGPLNLKSGIGGSETAVIQLSKEWASKGWKVVVYCDCGKQEGMHDGVLYLPYYKFNAKDNFNIFINWRSSHLAGRIKAKKFIIDLHDLYAPDTLKDTDKYDKVFVKSEFQRNIAKDIPDNKFRIVSNGI